MARSSRPIKRHTMSEQMAQSIQNAIVAGELESGAALPTEPELAEEYGVSRAVVRDATRILMARGLVNVVHGRGVFVTEPHNEAFGEALLLALQRVGATAWDVEQFESLVLPGIVGLAAQSATEKEVEEIRQLAEEYIRATVSFQTQWWAKRAPKDALDRYADGFRRLIKAIVLASHNHLAAELAGPLLQLRGLRRWQDTPDATPVRAAAAEARWVRALVDAIARRDPDAASAVVSRLAQLPAEAVQAMKETPVGEISVIPVPLPDGSSDPG